MHSFHAYIDEAGDDGFKFRDFPNKGSSEWFVVGALLVRETNKGAASRKWKAVLDPIETRRKHPVHFAKLQHDTQVALCHEIAKLPVRGIAVAVNKKALRARDALEGNRHLYFYCVRFLIERISWLTRDEHVNGQGDGRCRLNFSHCKGLSYESLREYFGKLHNLDTSIKWAHIDSDKFDVAAHDHSIWLRAADAMTSGLYKGLEVSEHGLCEDRFAKLLRPVIYNRRGRCLNYGLKLFPGVPAVEEQRDNRYSWLSLYEKQVE